MNREGFESQVDAFFSVRPCEDSSSAKEALVTLYDYVATNGRVAEGLERGTVAWSSLLFKIQQIMSWSPLRLFWQVLALDDSIIVRSCAKGNIAEATGEYFNDPEIGLISMANMSIMFNEDAVTGLQAELEQSESLQSARRLWATSTHGLRFAPMLKVHTF